MKKASFYLNLLLGFLILSAEISTSHASLRGLLDKSESTQRTSGSSIPQLCSSQDITAPSPLAGDIRPDNNSTHRQHSFYYDHESCTLKFRDLMKESHKQKESQQATQKSNDLEKLKKFNTEKVSIESQIQEYERILQENRDKTLKTIKEKLEEDKAYCESERLIETDEEILKTLEEDEASVDRQLMILNSPIQKMKQRYAIIVKSIGNVDRRLNNKESTNTYGDKLSEVQRQLIKMKAETGYYLPENFKGGVLISSEELLAVLESMSIETDNIDPQLFFNFAVATLELPVPYLSRVEDKTYYDITLSEHYISQINDIIEKYGFRMTEVVEEFRLFISMRDGIHENPEQEKEKKLADSLMKTSRQEEISMTEEALLQEKEKEKPVGKTLVEKDKTVFTIFSNNGSEPHKAKLDQLIHKAVSHPSGLFQVLCTGLENYTGFSFQIDTEISPFIQAAKKARRSKYDVTVEFYKTCNRLVRNYFNLRVLEVIHQKFQDSISKKA